jgi:Ca2+:H+ antiporter
MDAPIDHAMTAPSNRLPAWTVAVPIVALGTDLALHGRAGLLAAGALIVALVAAAIAAVHHAEVVALRVGEPFGAIPLALAVRVIELGLIVSIMLGDSLSRCCCATQFTRWSCS